MRIARLKRGLWSEAVRSLDRDTERSASEAFDRGEHAGAKLFLWQPLRAAVRTFRGGQSAEAVLAWYRDLVHAAKVWDLERRWREQSAVRFTLGSAHVLAQRDWRRVVGRSLLETETGEPLPGGRGGARRVETEFGPVVVRRFRRGGAMRWLGDRHFGWRSRPEREFWLLLRALQLGLPVPEPVAAVTEFDGDLVYRGMLITVEISGGVPLHEFVAAGHRDILPPVGRAIRRIHDAGLHHPDLNLGNILVVPGEEPSLVFIDLDRARLHAAPLGRRSRLRSLQRLRRSARKFDPEGSHLRDEDLDALQEAYGVARLT